MDSLGRMCILINMNPTIEASPMMIECRGISLGFSPPEEEDIIINRAITKMSCTNRKPIDIFPYSLSMSFLSDRSFIIMIVLLNVKAIAIYMDEIVEKPRSLLMKKPIREVKMICPMPVTRETFPTSFMTFGLRLIPTMKRRNVIPICEKTAMVSVDWTMFRK